MKKKYVLKKWVVRTILITFLIASIIGAMDFEDTKTFMITHIICATVMAIDIAILWTQTNIFE